MGLINRPSKRESVSSLPIKVEGRQGPTNTEMRINVYDDLGVIGAASIQPQDSITANTGVAVDGNPVDTKGFDNAGLYACLAIPNASTTAFSLAVVLQESADGVTSWSNALDNTNTAIGFTLTSIFGVTGTPTSGSKILTSVSSTAGLYVGQAISGVDIPANTVITAFTSNTITMSNAATGTPGSEALAFGAEGLARIEGLGLNRKRFLRAVVTPTQTGAGGVVALFANLLLGNAGERPINTAVSNT